MSLTELFIIALGLSMDAFAVSICKGLSLKEFHIKYAVLAGLYFGFFQGIMPVIGYFAGNTFSDIFTAIDHWVVFILLTLIGAKMVIESRKPENEPDPSFGIKVMLSLAVATSIDALAVGISFAFLNANIIFSAVVICIITFAVSAIGVAIGNYFGDKFHSKAELVGGIILILIGVKILIEHLSSNT